MTVNSPVPPTAPIKSERSNEFIMKSQKALVDTYAWQCCMNCEHWGEVHKIQVPDETKYSGFREEDLGPGCTKYSEDPRKPIRPPTEVITIGCTGYEPSIPF